ncbi:MAG: type I-U CRISPR-associated helicase/endonuclease Cas3, partial [Planctomycetia bacterium]|nr:type I-U CRISPR-associated helicase/endonuclease Cas3 [Planctomycetia bacterium]
WALTTIRDKLPGRPPVEKYLHGVTGWEPPETHVAWREEVWVLRLQFKNDEDRKRNEAAERKRLAKFAEELLGDYSLKPQELLRDRSDRVFKHLAEIAKRHPDNYTWLVDDEGGVEVFTLKELADKDEKDRINGRTVLLPEQAGGLHEGLLDGGATETVGLDVSDEWYADDAKTIHRRLRLWSDDEDAEEKAEDMRLIRRIDFPAGDDEDADGRTWRWFERPRGGDDEGSKSAATKDPITWDHHTNDVTNNTKRIVKALRLTDELQQAFILAAKFHDLGKQREVWQRSIGNPKPKGPPWFAKSGRAWKPREITDYRHEFGSLLDIQREKVFTDLEDDDLKMFVLHIIATHHGRGRPHFPVDEAFDPEPNGRDAEKVAREVPRRFARLQRKYGRWGLAYLESLLRAADYAASANPSKFETEGES